MLQYFKYNMLHDWNAMRIIRGSLGILLIIQAIMYRDVPMAILGIVFLLQVLTNTGCCVGGACNISTVPHKTEDEQEEFEIINTPSANANNNK